MHRMFSCEFGVLSRAKGALVRVSCVWNADEGGYQCLFEGLPFKRAIAYVRDTGHGHFIDMCAEVFFDPDDEDNSSFVEYHMTIQKRYAAKPEKIAARILGQMIKDWS